MQSPYVRLAVQSFTYYLKTGKPMQIPDVLPEELTNKQAGAFVTLYKNGNLRGCIGTINPIRNSLAEEIIMNAISAAFRDPRFPPITADELPDIVCSVDVLETPEPVSDMRTLDVKTYGVIVSRGHRRGLLLPNIDGVDTVEEQVDIARQKAGIAPHESFTLERFKVVRHT